MKTRTVALASLTPRQREFVLALLEAERQAKANQEDRRAVAAAAARTT